MGYSLQRVAIAAGGSPFDRLAAALGELRRDLSSLEVCINNLVLVPGPQGPRGIQGEVGPQGLQGAPGTQGAVGRLITYRVTLPFADIALNSSAAAIARCERGDQILWWVLPSGLDYSDSGHKA